MLNLSELSPENLNRIQKVLKIILDTVELQGLNRLAGNKIPLKRFEKEGFGYEEVKSILNKITKEENGAIQVINEIVKESLKTNFLILESPFVREIFLKEYGFSLDDLYENKILLLQIKNLNKLREIKGNVDKKPQERAITRAKEIRRQFAEMNERREEKEALKREIIDETNKKLEEQRKIFEKLSEQISSFIPQNNISAFKQYEELLKEISKQSKPIKDALEQAGKLQSTYKLTYIKNYLTPALQRLAPYL